MRRGQVISGRTPPSNYLHRNYSSENGQLVPRLNRISLNVRQTRARTRTQSERTPSTYIITTLLGIYGGLSVALRMIIPFLFESIAQHIEKCRLQQRSW